jgi:hypothetical protein
VPNEKECQACELEQEELLDSQDAIRTAQLNEAREQVRAERRALKVAAERLRVRDPVCICWTNPCRSCGGPSSTREKCLPLIIAKLRTLAKEDVSKEVK